MQIFEAFFVKFLLIASISMPLYAFLGYKPTFTILKEQASDERWRLVPLRDKQERI